MKKILFIILLVACTKQINAQVCFNTFGNYAVGNSPTAIITADFNKDGKLDLATTNLGTDNVSIMLGAGTGAFGSTANFPLATNSQPLFLCTADFNEDGFLDVATANSNVNNVSVLLGTGTGVFGTANTYTTPGTPFSICTADFNGDGHMDLAATNENLNNISVLLGTGTGTFGLPSNFPTGTNPYAICTGDFNNDHKPDLAIGNDGSSNVTILTNISTSTVSATFTTSATVNTGYQNPRSIISLDINSDGNLDLAIANEGNDNVSILMGAGTGTFSIGPTDNIIPGSSAPRCVISADFNGDGNPDLATADYGNFSAYYISIVFNAIGGNQNINLGANAQSPHGICSGDFNGDGAPDLAVVGEATNNAFIYLNGYPTVKISGDSLVCSGNSTTLTASGANTGIITWSNSGATTTTIAVTPTANTTYSVTNQNASCSYTATAAVTVSIAATPSVNIIASPTLVCAGSTVTLTASGASTYTWSTGATGVTTTDTPTNYTTYAVTGASVQGCTATATYTMNVYGKPNLTVNSPTICAGQTAIVSVNGASGYTITAAGVPTYTYYSLDSSGYSIPKHVAFTPSVTTTFWVEAISGYSGCTNSDTTVVTVNPLPNVQINGTTNDFNFICTGNSDVLNASGANTYTWSTSAQATHITVTPTNGAFYNVTGTDGNGCKNSAVATYSTYALPTVTVNSESVCAGTNVTLTAGGASTYTWSTSATTNTILVVAAGNTSYTVIGTDANTCTNTAVATISAPANPAPDICMVTTDSATNYAYNIVYWDKTLYLNADSFIVYRYDVLGNNYLRLGATSKDSLSAFMDTARYIGTGGSTHNGDPSYGSWKYKLAVKDSCGSVSAQSPYHQTVFLQNQNNGNFNVSQYVIETGQANPVSGYFLYRDDLGTNNYQALVPVSGTSATDPNYSSYPNANYRVDILGFNCNPTLRLANGNNSTYAAKIRSHSNTNNNKMSGINKINAGVNEVKVYPNPANNFITIQSNTELGYITLYNALGETVMQLNSKNAQEQIDMSKLAAGVYTIEAKNSFTKVIKED
ncbi:MAG TPA: FG-GAP-like repeat-containing protein [Bacteroidia bacterium]|nr:FG-GAP-like repeat-containing protein [Bacteroidia bacterium]